jgi:hypothetical protein
MLRGPFHEWRRSWPVPSSTHHELLEKCGDVCFSQLSMPGRVDFDADGLGVWLLNSLYNAKRTRIASSLAKSFGVNTFLWMIEK